jgi:GT2 family glycosyltransferase
MIKLAIAILNWSGKALLQKFLPVVIEHSNYPGAEVIVIDNDSSDDSVEFLTKEYPSVSLIQLDHNYGFAGGYNKGLSQIDAEYFLLLNSDVAPEANWLKPLMEQMEQDSSIGACMPKVRAYNEPEMFEYAGASGGYIDFLGYPFCRGRILNKIEKDKGQYNEPISVFWATGAAILIRSELYHSSGGVDESFFAHMEEIDLCWRIKNLGYKILAIPQSEVLHVGGATLSQQNAHKTYLNFRNNLLMMVKNLPGEKLIPVLFLRMILDGVAGLHFVLKGELKFFMAVLKAHFSFYGRLKGVWAKRKKITHKAIKTGHDEIYPQSIIWAYYFKGLRKFSQLKHFHLD